MNSLEKQDLTPLEQNTYQLSVERQRELDDAKNALKKIVNSIPSERLKAMNDLLTSFLIMGCDGDVDKYVRLKMECNAGNAPDVAAFHVTENLIRIKEYLESQN